MKNISHTTADLLVYVQPTRKYQSLKLFTKYWQLPVKIWWVVVTHACQHCLQILWPWTHHSKYLFCPPKATSKTCKTATKMDNINYVTFMQSYLLSHLKTHLFTQSRQSCWSPNSSQRHRIMYLAMNYGTIIQVWQSIFKAKTTAHKQKNINNWVHLITGHEPRRPLFIKFCLSPENALVLRRLKGF